MSEPKYMPLWREMIKNVEREDYRQLISHAEYIENQLSQLTQECDAVRREHGQLKADLSVSQDEMHRYREKWLKLQKERDALKAVNADLFLNNDGIHAQCVRLQAQLATAKEALEKIAGVRMDGTFTKAVPHALQDAMIIALKALENLKQPQGKEKEDGTI